MLIASLVVYLQMPLQFKIMWSDYHISKTVCSRRISSSKSTWLTTHLPTPVAGSGGTVLLVLLLVVVVVVGGASTKEELRGLSEDDRDLLM